MEPHALPRLAPRRADAHKGDFGHVLVLAGSPRYTGAAYLCAEAAVRSGAGLVTLGIPETIHPWMASRAVCWMTLPLPATGEGMFDRQAAKPALAFLESCDALVVGPGLGRSDATSDFLDEVLNATDKPAVVDADALHLAAARSGGPRFGPDGAARVLTPHPGEAGRIVGRPTAEVQADREGMAATMARSLGAVVVLKGSGTVVTDGRRLYVNATGNPGMASGGTGDVLAGAIGALLAGGMHPMDAAAFGVYIHGSAGDLARDRVSETACSAAELLDQLGRAFANAGSAHADR